MFQWSMSTIPHEGDTVVEVETGRKFVCTKAEMRFAGDEPYYYVTITDGTETRTESEGEYTNYDDPAEDSYRVEPKEVTP